MRQHLKNLMQLWLRQTLNWIYRFFVGGTIYVGMEVLYDNSSDRSMALLGGLSFLIGGALDELLPKTKIRIRSLIISILILILEYYGGLFFNSDYSIWDYRHLPLNLDGQICLYFGLIWFFLISPFIQWFDEQLRHERTKSLLWYYIANIIGEKRAVNIK